MERTIAPEKLILDAPGQQVIDVRRPADREASAEKLEGSVWRDPNDVEKWSQSLEKNKDLILYCVRGGSASQSVVDALHAKGLRARYVEGGIEGWKAKGGAVVPK